MKRFGIAVSMMVPLLVGCMDATTGTGIGQADLNPPLAFSEIDLGVIAPDETISLTVILTDPTTAHQVVNWETSCDCLTVTTMSPTAGRSGTALRVELSAARDSGSGMYRIDVDGLNSTGSTIASFVVQFVTAMASPDSG